MMKSLRDNDRCYVCGKSNPSGLAVDFVLNNETRSIRARFTPTTAHQGFEGIVHGGILAALLDEAMGKLAFGLGLPALTAEMTTRFKSPAAPGQEIIVSGRLTGESPRLIRAEARIEQGPVIIAEATGKLLRI